MKAQPVKYAQATCHGSQPGTIEAVLPRYVKCATPNGIKPRPYSTLAMRRPLSPVAKPRCCRSQSPANDAYSTQAAATITGVSPEPDQVSCAVGAREMWRALNNSSPPRGQASDTRAGR